MLNTDIDIIKTEKSYNLGRDIKGSYNKHYNFREGTF